MGRDDGNGGLPRQLARAIRRDPHHLPEQVVLLAQSRLAEPSRAWAAGVLQDADADLGVVAEQLRTQTARFARTNGALSGTPFLIALVPAYVSVLWEQARMVMRIAALEGRDPREPAFAAELLCLRGLYETPEAAQAGLEQLGTGPPGEVKGVRDRVVAWYRLVYRILILAGLLAGGGAEEDTRGRVRRTVSLVFGGALYLLTWVVPLTFMMLMSYSCENDTRGLGDRAMAYYDIPKTQGSRAVRSRGARPGLRAVAFVVSLAIPFGIVVLAIAQPTARVAAIAGVAGLAFVLALSARAARR